MTKLSIIIVSYNTKELLSNCLESILRYPPEGEFEVVVVDNGSSDGSTEAVRKRFPQVRVISNRENAGFSAANNQGIRRSTGAYVLLLNSDTEMLEGTLQAMLAFMDMNLQTAAVGCQLVLPDGTAQPFSHGKDPSLLYLVHRIVRMLLKREYMHDWGDNELSKVETDWVSGACMMLRREAVDSVGYLDENIFMYFEDNDWCHRARSKGWRVRFLPRVRVVHLGGRSLASDDPARKADYYRSLIYFYGKHYSVVSQILLRGLLLFYRFFLARQINTRIEEAER
jgi:GT2 family glycosyltransferase